MRDEGRVGEPCELTGIPTKFDLHRTCAEALREGGQRAPEHKWVGRDWVPLAGSLGNDAQALPAASRPLHVSARALLALQFLPQGLFLFQGRLACYQSTYSPLMQELTASQVDYYIISLLRETMRFAAKEKARHPRYGCCWKYLASSGTADATRSFRRTLICISGSFQTQAPARIVASLRFPTGYSDFSGNVLRTTSPARSMRSFAMSQRPPIAVLTAIREERDFRGLYPFKKWPGASQRFFELYQRKVCGCNAKSLQVARGLAILR